MLRLLSSKHNDAEIFENHLNHVMLVFIGKLSLSTGELGYDRLNGTRKIDPSYAKSVVYI